MKVHIHTLAWSLAVLGLAGCDDGEIIGLPDNTAPVASITANPTVVPRNDANQTIVTIDGAASFDADGDELGYEWTVPSGRFENGTSNSDAVIQVSFPGAAPYVVTLVINDGRGGSDSAEITIGLGDPDPAPNESPVASFTADPLAIPAGDGNQTIVTLDASASFDPDGDPISFEWVVESATFENGTGPGDAIAQVSFPGSAPYRVTLTVTDDRGASDSTEGTIELLQPVPNQTPSATIETSHTEVPAGDNNQTIVTLDGSGSSDPDGDTLTFAWSVQGGRFENGTAADDEVIQVSFPGVADYAVSLVVDDGNGNTDEANIVIELGS